MSRDRATDLKVERAAVVAVERSILRLTDLTTATPSSDLGIDLLAFRPDPFAAAPIQVKGAASGLTVHSKYADSPVIVAYVFDPMGDEPVVCIMTGAEAWRLPLDYIAAGGRAHGHSTPPTYRWNSISRLLREVLESRVATSERWMMLFEAARAK